MSDCKYGKNCNLIKPFKYAKGFELQTDRLSKCQCWKDKMKEQLKAIDELDEPPKEQEL